ncbi:MAG: restriction endonuclease [Spirochaetes bacterium]|nr:restriction endonuclease [Spirochaetota bacterium]
MSNQDYTIYAIKAAEDPHSKLLLFESLQKGEGRFGWSYIPEADMHELQKRVKNEGWDSLSEDEQNCYHEFLLEIKQGDYVIYINVPIWGQCSVAKVIGPYEWRYDEEDFNHRFKVDPSSVFTFDRNEAMIHPYLRARLKLRGRYWRIYAKKEFQELLQAYQAGLLRGVPRSLEYNLMFLEKNLEPVLQTVTEGIYKTHPNFELEELIATVFKKVPGVKEVERKSGRGDKGADIIIRFESGLPILGLLEQKTCIIQVKSYTGEQWDTRAVDDIKRAFQQYPEAEYGIIVSTGLPTKTLEEEIEKLIEETGKTVSLLIGNDLAKFFLKYGLDF